MLFSRRQGWTVFLEQNVDYAILFNRHVHDITSYMICLYNAVMSSLLSSITMQKFFRWCYLLPHLYTERLVADSECFHIKREKKFDP